MSIDAGLSARVAVNAPLLAASRLTSAAAGAAALAISARYLGPDAFGALTVATLFVSLVSVFCDVGLYLVAAREVSRSPEQQHAILRSTHALGLLASAITAGVAFGLSRLLFSGPEDHQTEQAIYILGISFLTIAPTGTIGARLIADERAWITQAVPALGALMTLVILFAVIAFDLGFTAVALAYAAAAVVNVAVLLLVAGRGRDLMPRVDLRIWRRILSFAVPQAAIIVLSVVYFRADGLLLAWLGTTRDVALYGVAFKVYEVLLALAAQSTLVLFPAIARLEPGDRRLNEIMTKALATFHVLIVPMVVLGVLFSPAIVLALGGGSYTASADVLAILMPALGLSYYKALFGNALIALGRQRRLVRYALNVAVFNVALNLALIPLLGVHGAALALLATELVSLAAAVALYREAAPVPTIAGLGKTVAAGGALAAVAALGVGLGAAVGTIPGAIVGTGLALAAYTVALRRLGAVPPELRVAASTLARRVRRTT